MYRPGWMQRIAKSAWVWEISPALSLVVWVIGEG
jgi:hypothetical protein